ncbi:hypothetical protein C8A01DRAFT_21487, partial [Parachaetomium inaequale]
AAHPPPSSERDIEIDRTPAITFEELPFEDTVLKRVFIKGSLSTFIVQRRPRAYYNRRFATHFQGIGTNVKRDCLARQKSNRTTKHKGKPASISRRARYTPADDTTIL